MSDGIDLTGIGSLDTMKLIEAHVETIELLKEIKALLQEIKEELQGD